MLCCGMVRLQEEELKAAMDKAVEAETRASEAEIRMKEMKASLGTLRHCRLLQLSWSLSTQPLSSHRLDCKDFAAIWPQPNCT
jgi:hypothetical protein